MDTGVYRREASICSINLSYQCSLLVCKQSMRMLKLKKILVKYLGWRLARAPGGREEQPMVNCMKAFLSVPLISTKTHSQILRTQEIPCCSKAWARCTSWSPPWWTRCPGPRTAWCGPTTDNFETNNICLTKLTSLGVKSPNLSMGKTVLKPCLRASICCLIPRTNTHSSVL